MQVAALFYLSEPATAVSTTFTSLPGGNGPGVKDGSASFGADPDSVEEAVMDEARKKELRSLVIHELLQTSKRKGPPHQLSQHGEYSGWVWTMPESRYCAFASNSVHPSPCMIKGAESQLYTAIWLSSLQKAVSLSVRLLQAELHAAMTQAMHTSSCTSYYTTLCTCKLGQPL